jgi:hypothetical protein
MHITISELRQCGITWPDICRITGGNEWALKEGLLQEDSSIELSIETAKKVGLLKEEGA